MNQHKYIISGGKPGAERLKVLFETLLPGTLELFSKSGITDVNSILDIGCGSGDITAIIAELNQSAELFAYDFDPSILSIAETKLKDKSNVKLGILDINTDDIGSEKYDVIVSRFLLSHLFSPADALNKFYNALITNGKIIIEDVDFYGHFCYPQNDSFDKYVELYADISIKRGMDPYIGRKLFTLLNDAGFKQINLEIANPAFNSGAGKLMGILTLKNIAQSILDEGILSQPELDSLIQNLEHFTERADSLISLPRIFRITGVKE
jgi:SAM-dependent methyltransferase